MPRSLIWHGATGGGSTDVSHCRMEVSPRRVETAGGLLTRHVLRTGTTRSRFGRSVYIPLTISLLASNLWHDSFLWS
jgi:hypothetical protein